ncbi:signal peptidase I [Neobacillus cucumis]|uniref:signal peptidase I n=1 Tax=Neobacillus cucumis TaxID=1740721 RepID=UPI0019654D50|nr:signal peptidase I [Neobacillus cucumis]MBM7651840.1 signal peptidase [Neobacillus cucumis]
MQIDIHTFTLLKKAINKDGWLELPSSGNSMYPLIQKGNICRFVPCKTSLFKKGDVLLYYSQTGELVAHRFVKKVKMKDQTVLVLKGDTNLGYDQPIEENWILGKLVNVQKKHLTITTNHVLSRLWGTLILSNPFLSGILRNYLNRKLDVHFN